MISSAIWNKQARVIFFLQSLKKLTSAYSFEIARKKTCDYALIIYMENIRDGLL